MHAYVRKHTHKHIYTHTHTVHDYMYLPYVCALGWHRIFAFVQHHCNQRSSDLSLDFANAWRMQTDWKMLEMLKFARHGLGWPNRHERWSRSWWETKLGVIWSLGCTCLTDDSGWFRIKTHHKLTRVDHQCFATGCNTKQCAPRCNRPWSPLRPGIFWFCGA